jgi:hypothetical protein
MGSDVTEPMFEAPGPNLGRVGDANGSAEIVDLAAVMAATRPARVVRVNAADLRPESLTAAEISEAGRLLGQKPSQLMRTLAERDSWEAIDFGYIVVWLVMRRREPDLTYETVRAWAIEIAPDPTPAPAATSAPPGTDGPLTSRARRASRRPTPDV